jgi:osmotically-inducible protein OsmY
MAGGTATATLVRRTPQEIGADVAQQLAESPFIDVSDISVTVDGSEVTLTGTINSLIAISLAQALTSNVPGVGRVQVRLRVRPATRTYETAGTVVHKIEGE